MIKRILEIPKPLAKTTLFTSPLFGVNALGTSIAGTISVRTGRQNVSAQPAGLIAIRHAVKVPVALYWCCTGALDAVSKLSPSPKSHLKFTASGEARFVKVVIVFSIGGSG